MSIISLNFFIFFFIIMTVYYLIPGKIQWMWLLAASLYFYAYHNSLIQTVIFVLIIMANYGLSVLGANSEKSKKTFYVITLVMDVVLLSVFKYSAFIFNMLETLGLSSLHDIFSFITDSIAVFEPMHISYFALILIGYITDVYWGKSQVQKNPGKLLLFCSYFPVMTSGPIVRYSQLENQLFSGSKVRFSYEKVVRGLERICWGLFKKLVVSSRCAILVNAVYGDYEKYTGFYVFVAVIVYAFQIYTDFSGLIDMVLGFSECIGIDLPENFNTPFFSRSIAEFWRRWHITLGAFLKDYVLFSLQRGNSYKKLRNFCKNHLGKDYKKKFNLPVYATMFVSWFLIGLWHGGGWNYIFGVGIYMWFIMVLSDILAPFFDKMIKKLNINNECASYHLFQQIRTFFIYIFGVSFFRASSMKEGIELWKSAFSSFNPWIFFNEDIYKLGLDRREANIMIFGLLLILLASYITYKEDRDIRDWLREQNYVFRLLVFTGLFVSIIVLGSYGSEFNAADFIYGRF